MDGILVNESRWIMGVKLVDKFKEIFGEEGIKEIDVIIFILEIVFISVQVVLDKFGIFFFNGFIKNCYVYCIFIFFG